MKTVFVGGGRGCRAVLEMSEHGRLDFLDLDILAVVDIDPTTPAMRFARDKGWRTLTGIADGLSLDGLQLVIELTGFDEVLTQIYRHLPEGVRVMDHVMARVFWDLEKATISLREKLEERDQLERSTAESERRYRQIINTVHGVITIKDLDGRYRMINPRAEKFFGLSREQVLGRTATQLFSRETAQVIELNDAEALALETHHISEEVLHFGDRQRVLIAERFLLTDSDDKVSRICLVARDVTRQRALQQEMVQTERLAAVGKLAAGVAHELNNPLTGILTFAEDLYEEAAADDPRRADYEVLVSETLRCRRIVQDLLDYSRQKPPERVRTSLNPVVGRTLSLIERQASFLNIEIDPRLADSLPDLEIDPGQVQQALLNLVINARDAMSTVGRIEIATGLDEDGRHVRLSVTDSGCGIPEDAVDQIFEPFFSTKGEQGNGLGLPAVASVMEQHDGRVEVVSAVGHGSAFTLVFPVDPDIQHEEAR